MVFRKIFQEKKRATEKIFSSGPFLAPRGWSQKEERGGLS